MALTNRPVTVAGGAPVFDAATFPAGDTIPGSVVATGRCKILASNPTAGAITVTMVDPGSTPGGEPNPDKDYVVAAAVAGDPGLNEWFVPLSFVDPSDGLVHLTYSAGGLNLSVRTV